MSLPNLSMLILATFGLKEKGAWIYEPTESNPWPKRSAASAGGLYPLEIYPLVIGPVEGLELGLYHLNIKTFSLEPLPLQVRFDEIPNIIPALNFATNAKVVFLIVGVFPRSYGKYGRRAYRFVLIEVGHVQAHLGLASSALGLGYFNACVFDDRKIEDLLYIDGVDESLLGVGISG